MDMVLSWSPQLVLNHARWGMGILWVNGTSLPALSPDGGVWKAGAVNTKRDHILGEHGSWPTDMVGKCTPLHLTIKFPTVNLSETCHKMNYQVHVPTCSGYERRLWSSSMKHSCLPWESWKPVFTSCAVIVVSGVLMSPALNEWY